MTTHEYSFFAPTTLTCEETLATISQIGHEISQRTRSRIRYDRSQNRIEIQSESAEGLSEAKKRLKDALWAPSLESVADKKLAAERKRRWNKERNEFWENPDEHPEPQSKAKMTRIKITPIHTHKMIVRHSLHGDWMTQLATESHCTLDWQDEMNVIVQSFDEDQVQTFLDRLEVITRQLMRNQKQKMHVILDLNAIIPENTMIHWKMPDGLVKGASGHELRCRPYLSDPEVIYESAAIAEADRLRQAHVKSATNMVAQALDQCRSYTGDVQLVFTLGKTWCVIKNPNVMAKRIEQPMDPLKPGQWNLFNKLCFDRRYIEACFAHFLHYPHINPDCSIDSETQVVVQRLSSLYGRQALHMPSMLRYELDINIPAKFFTHIPDDQVIVVPNNNGQPSKLNGSTEIQTRLHLYPSVPATGVMDERVPIEYLDCRKVTCCAADKFEMLWLLPGAGFDVHISVVGQLANPQLTKLVGQVAAAIRVKSDGSLALSKEIPNCKLVASRRKEAWMWHDIGENGEELTLNHVHEWSDYNKVGNSTTQERYHTVQLGNPKWAAMLAQQPLLPMGEAAHWIGTDFIGPQGSIFASALEAMRRLANLVID